MDGDEERKQEDGLNNKPKNENDPSAKESKSEPAVRNLNEDASAHNDEPRSQSYTDYTEGKSYAEKDEDSDDLNTNEDATLSWLKTGKVSFADDAILVRIFNENSADIGQNFEDSLRVNELKSSLNFGKGKGTSKERFGLLNATLANLFWKYPNVSQNVEVYPILTNRAALASARKRSEKLQGDLKKQGKSTENIKTLERQRSKGPSTSASKGKIAKDKNVKMDKDGKRVSQQKHLDKIRRFSESAVSGSHSHHSMYTFRSDNAVSAEEGAHRNEILDQIREKNEDIEKNGCSAKCTKWKRKCMAPFEKCFESQKCTCFVFGVLITLVVVFCIGAIVYPLINVSKKNQ